MFGLFGKKKSTEAEASDQPRLPIGPNAQYADGALSSRFFAAVDRAVRAQDSTMDKYINHLRSSNPGKSQAELQEQLDKHFRNLATGSGVANGGVAALPGLGTMLSVATIGAEGVMLLEVCALYALASAKLRGLDTDREDLRRTLVLLSVAGGSGNELLRSVAEQKGLGSLLSLRSLRTLPAGELNRVNSTLGRLAMRTLRRRLGGAMFQKMLPFGIGAVLGGRANRKLANMMIEQVHTTLDQLPAQA